MEVNIMGILRTKRDNNKFKEARKWLDKHPEEIGRASCRERV